MKKPVILIATLLVGILLILIQRARQPNVRYSAESEEIGRSAPTFQLKDMEGRLVSLEDFKGRSSCSIFGRPGAARAA